MSSVHNYWNDFFIRLWDNIEKMFLLAHIFKNESKEIFCTSIVLLKLKMIVNFFLIISITIVTIDTDFATLSKKCSISFLVYGNDLQLEYFYFIKCAVAWLAFILVLKFSSFFHNVDFSRISFFTEKNTFNFSCYFTFLQGNLSHKL